MKLEQKYFYPFVGGITVFLLFVIAVYTFDYSEKQQEAFVTLVNTSGVLDTLHISTFDGSQFQLSDSLRKPVTVLVFWAGWSEKSIAFLKTVAASNPDPEHVEIIGLLVKDQPEEVRSVLQEIPGITWAVGTQLYGTLLVPGVPSAIAWRGPDHPVAVVAGNYPERIQRLFFAEQE